MKTVGAAGLLLFVGFIALCGADESDGTPTSPGATLVAAEFADRPVEDILTVLAGIAGVTLLTDESVSGSASCYLVDVAFEQALTLLLEPRGFFWWLDGGIYRVSRVRITTTDGQVSIDADNVEPELLLRIVQRRLGVTIAASELPARSVSLYCRAVSLRDAVLRLSEALGGYEVTEADGVFRLEFSAGRRGATPPGMSAAGSPPSGIAQPGSVTIQERSDGTLRLQSTPGSAGDVAAAFYRYAETPCVVLTDPADSCAALDISAPDLASLESRLLSLLLAQAVRSDGVVYIVGISPDRQLDLLRRPFRVTLVHTNVASAERLLPRNLAQTSSLVSDAGTNSFVLFGTEAEIAPLLSYIAEIEAAHATRIVRRYELAACDAAELRTSLPATLADCSVSALGRGAVIVELPEAKLSAFEQFLAAVDVPEPVWPVELRYLDAELFLERLPPGVDRGRISLSPDPRKLYLRGSRARRDDFVSLVAEFDAPAPQILYELLVIEYHESRSADFSLKLENSVPGPGRGTAILGAIGPALGLNVDVLSMLGYRFAFNLSAAIAESEARVVADTTVRGGSGERIRFENTNTNRYRDLVVDPETGKAELNGGIREITSGLTVEVRGRVGGGGLITIDLEASMSKRGENGADDQASLPATSEKLVQTTVTTAPGRPVAICGLAASDDTQSVRKTPLLSEIPLLGALFRASARARERSELSIFLLPRIVNADGSTRSEKERLARRIGARVVEVANALNTAPGELNNE